jgi:uncharacterized protein
MPQTAPAHFVVGRKLTDTELAQAIRLDLEAELDAMNLYQSHIDSTDNDLARKVLAHIRDEEREHASLFWALLKHLDPKVVEEDSVAMEKLRLIAEGKSESEIEAVLEAKEAGHPPPAADPAAPPAPPPTARLTVGSLRKPRG